VVGLGYFGGTLVFGARVKAAPQEFKVGMGIFDNNCSGCHPHGGNIIKPNLPLIRAPELAQFDSFVAFIRNPTLPDGSKGPMPDFPEKKISQKQAEQLYQYITEVLAKRGP
jgi:mono/diheme cytochrome c family protein